jgi:hypothetical protein
MNAFDERDRYLGYREAHLDRPAHQVNLEAVAHRFDIFQPDFPKGAGAVNTVSSGYVAQWNA